jgi:hypothetical protein
MMAPRAVELAIPASVCLSPLREIGQCVNMRVQPEGNK